MNIGRQLIDELVADPKNFSEKGKAYDLLQEYFNGFPIDTLRPLLSSDDPYIKSAAAFVASELGAKGCPLIEDVIPLLKDDNLRIQASALEFVMVCSSGENANEFVHIVRALESANKDIRNLAMFLISNANVTQLKAGMDTLTDKDFNEMDHKRGLLMLLAGNSADPNQILEMIDDKSSIVKKYATIAAKRTNKDFPNLIKHAMQSSDAEVREFAIEAIN